MASIFTFQDEPPRVHSPWSTPGTSTPQGQETAPTSEDRATDSGQVTNKIRLPRLEPERQEGPVEYKLHLLLSHPTTSGRQLRLRQLTTQLLWRLQQSSPYHSSSNANLILPILPDVTTTLVVPEHPSRILPGLEESEGALYEIGVADDGTLVGLSSKELQDSLNNLMAMASSIGCVLEPLRKILVGTSTHDVGSSRITRKDELWVAEVLVRPDIVKPKSSSLLETRTPMAALSDTTPADRSAVEQIRITLVGASTTGKSSLLGCLTTSTLDNGRGKSRLSLLRHRHEMATGVTSSVAQELVGYRRTPPNSIGVVNYASGDVSSWSDIHNLADRLVFISDSPGLPKFAKSTYRTLISWKPQWTLLCIAADDSDNATDAVTTHLFTRGDAEPDTADQTTDLSLAHLKLCLKLELQIIIVITKMDMATKYGLRSVLSKTLSVLKAANKKPVLLKSETLKVDQDVQPDLQEACLSDHEDIVSIFRTNTDHATAVTPIIMTSAVSGTGILKLHTLLSELKPFRSAPRPSIDKSDVDAAASFHVDDVYFIPPSKVYARKGENLPENHGVVLSGIVNEPLSVGDEVSIGPFILEQELHEAHPLSRRSLSTSGPQNLAKSSSAEFSRSLPTEQLLVRSQSRAMFVRVKVVSLRNLRVPVRSMKPGETGTIGVELIDEHAEITSLSRARKGMVLLSVDQEHSAFRSFTASFSKSGFTETNSPPMLLGGNAIVYVNSVRAAVRLVSVRARDEELEERQELMSTGLFNFEDADEDAHSAHDKAGNGHLNDEASKEIEITFRFVSTMEWLRVHDQVLVVPTLSAAGPVTGPVPPSSALHGFVGKVQDAHV